MNEITYCNKSGKSVKSVKTRRCILSLLPWGLNDLVLEHDLWLDCLSEKLSIKESF